MRLSFFMFSTVLFNYSMLAGFTATLQSSIQSKVIGNLVSTASKQVTTGVQDIGSHAVDAIAKNGSPKQLAAGSLQEQKEQAHRQSLNSYVAQNLHGQNEIDKTLITTSKQTGTQTAISDITYTGDNTQPHVAIVMPKEISTESKLSKRSNNKSADMRAQQQGQHLSLTSGVIDVTREKHLTLKSTLKYLWKKRIEVILIMICTIILSSVISILMNYLLNYAGLKTSSSCSSGPTADEIATATVDEFIRRGLHVVIPQHSASISQTETME